MKMVYYHKETKFKGFDQNVVQLNFKGFHGLENGETIFGKSSSN